MKATTHGEAMPSAVSSIRATYEVWYEDDGAQLLGLFADKDAATDVARTMSEAWGCTMRVRKLG